jgi:hypothetical protein
MEALSRRCGRQGCAARERLDAEAKRLEEARLLDANVRAWRANGGGGLQ